MNIFFSLSNILSIFKVLHLLLEFDPYIICKYSIFVYVGFNRKKFQLSTLQAAVIVFSSLPCIPRVLILSQTQSRNPRCWYNLFILPFLTKSSLTYIVLFILLLIRQFLKWSGVSYKGVYLGVGGTLNKCPDFFCIGTFIDRIHMKL